MYSKFKEGTGNDYFKTGVEIENSGIADHHQTMREIQKLRISMPTKVFERTELRIENVDAGTFIWTFKNPKTGVYLPTEQISVNATAS